MKLQVYHSKAMFRLVKVSDEACGMCCVQLYTCVQYSKRLQGQKPGSGSADLSFVPKD